MRQVVLVAVLAAACSDVVLTQGAVDLEAGTLLLDFGDVAVGEEAVATVPFSVRIGPGRITGANVLPVQGTGFAVVGDTSFELDPDARTGVDVAFRPIEEGYAAAVVQIATNDGRQTRVDVEVRGRGVSAELVALPPVLDLGPVAVGDTVIGEVTLVNEGTRAVRLDGASASRAELDVGDVFPTTLPGSGSFTVPMSFTASTPSAVQILVSFTSGSAVVAELVRVVANDCVRGEPSAYDVDGDGVTSCGGDCDDADDEVGPGRPERPNGVDDDCDRTVDEGTVAYDDDGDGFCEGPAACVGSARPGDCDDTSAARSPSADEQPDNGVDDDCDGAIDPGAEDGDGDGWATSGGDCDDSDPRRHPGRAEIADGVDDDCDGTVDEGTVAYDDDGDGFCESPVACVGGARPRDCDDSDATRLPGGTETPDGLDDDCDGTVDEGTTRYDDDGDGFTELGGDCDDDDPDVSPARGGCAP